LTDLLQKSGQYADNHCYLCHNRACC